jgi:FkbM family methyltransferase
MGLGEPKLWRVRPSYVQHAVIARLCGSSDMQVFWQVFTSDEYSCLRNMEGIARILDLGANVGYSSAYFLSCFPEAQVVAVEPDGQNAAVCRVNLAPYGDRALLLLGAVWTESASLTLSKGPAGNGHEWARQVAAPSVGEVGDVQGWDMVSLIDRLGGGDVDLLKVDIEGAELAVFVADAIRWLPRIRNICIELHTPECQEVFFRSLADFNYELEHSGELTICRNIRPRD